MKLYRIIQWFLCFSCSGLFGQNTFRWETKADWAQIKAKAKQQDKLIFVDCYASWCVPCKKMDKEVYTNESVASYFNDHFVNVKLQMDSTRFDNEITRTFYSIVKKIQKSFQILGYPTLIFLSPDGLLINKELGFKNSEQLIEIAKTAPSKILFYEQLKKYKEGIKDYKQMMELSEFVHEVIGDQDLSAVIASDYIAHLDSSQLLTMKVIDFVKNIKKDPKLASQLALKYKENFLRLVKIEETESRKNLQFILKYPETINSSDSLFKLCYYHPKTFDSTVDREGAAESILIKTITKEELNEKLIGKGKITIIKNPNWDSLKLFIQKKYPKINSEKLTLDFQITYYWSYERNWRRWAYYKDLRIKKYPPEWSDEVELTIELNDGGAWLVFRKCNDKEVLKKSLEWIDLALSLMKEKGFNEFPFAYCDTKANVLYKIGRRKDAIEWEQKAIRLAISAANEFPSEDKRNLLEQVATFKSIIRKMKIGEPTYLDQGAIWDANTTPKIRYGISKKT